MIVVTILLENARSETTVSGVQQNPEARVSRVPGRRNLLRHRPASQQDIVDAADCLHFTSSPRDQEKVAQQVYCPVTRTKTKPKNHKTKTKKWNHGRDDVCGLWTALRNGLTVTVTVSSGVTCALQSLQSKTSEPRCHCCRYLLPV